MRLPTALIRAAALLVAMTLGGTLAAQTANEADNERITGASNEMAFTLYRELSSEQESFVFSSWSIYTLLALLSGGARGTTADQIAAVLGVPGTGSGVHEAVTRIQDNMRAEGKAGAIELGIANALWPRERYPILPDYLELAARYGAEVTPVDYMREGRAVMKTLNDWAADATHGLVNEPISAPPPADTILMAGNAIYFKGPWQAQFDPRETIGQPFYGAHRTTEVPLMSERQEYRIIDEDDLQILEIPFLGERLAMIVVLPAVGQPLSRLEATLSPETVMTVVTQQWTDVVDVYLPRFTLKSQIDLRTHLQSMGITDLVVCGKGAAGRFRHRKRRGRGGGRREPGWRLLPGRDTGGYARRAPYYRERCVRNSRRGLRPRLWEVGVVAVLGGDANRLLW